MKIVASLNVPIEDQIRLFNASFEGYLAGFVPMDEVSFGGLLRSGGIDLSRSLIALGPHDEPAGLAYATIFAGRTRLALMGVAPKYQRKGCAHVLLKEFIEQAHKRGSRLVTLEVFEQNTPALRLYEKNGFNITQRLYGYSWDGKRTGQLVKFRESDLQELLSALMHPHSCEEPFQFSLFGMINEDRSLKICHHKGAWIAYKQTSIGRLHLKYLAQEKNDFEIMKELVWAVAAANREVEWTVPQIVPEAIALNVLEPLGFERLKLNQVQMNKELER